MNAEYYKIKDEKDKYLILLEKKCALAMTTIMNIEGIFIRDKGYPSAVSSSEQAIEDFYRDLELIIKGKTKIPSI